MGSTSAYERIKANVGLDGKLSPSFSLEERKDSSQLDFMPGAMDGIGIFHMGISKEKFVVLRITRLLKKYLKSGETKHLNNIASILNEKRTISLIDPVLNNLSISYENNNQDNIIIPILNLLKTSGNIELIKIGIGLLGVFDLSISVEAVDVITTLSLYEDFTLYAVVAASKWTNGNDIIFKIAKNVTGWGKVHAIERLIPETDEIEDWILRNGCSNDILDDYLGLICAVKGDLISALRQKTIDSVLFDSILLIVDALIREGPVAGISKYEHAKEAMLLFMSHAKKHVKRLDHLWHILNVQIWAAGRDLDYKNEIICQCKEIISKPEWKDKIVDAVEKRSDLNEFFYACNAAKRLDIDVSVELFEAVISEPLKYCSYMPQLLGNPKIANHIINLCETILPLDDMADGMGDFFFPDKLNREHRCLDFVLPELAAYPLKGVSLIKTGLNSKVVRSRNMSCRALSGWVKKSGKPLADISADLYTEIVRIYEIEVNEHTKETMKKLLDGEYED